MRGVNDDMFFYILHCRIHAWGTNLEEAFEQCAMGMFGYMTDIERVDNFGSQTIVAKGHDMLSLLFGFLDEFLFLFSAEPFFIARVSRERLV